MVAQLIAQGIRTQSYYLNSTSLLRRLAKAFALSDSNNFSYRFSLYGILLLAVSYRPMACYAVQGGILSGRHASCYTARLINLLPLHPIAV